MLTGSDGSGEQASNSVDAEEGAADDGGEDDEEARGDHLAQGGIGRDLDATGVVCAVGLEEDAKIQTRERETSMR